MTRLRGAVHDRNLVIPAVLAVLLLILALLLRAVVAPLLLLGTETWDAIRARRNVRAFTDRPVVGDDLNRILEAGRRAPSASNWQPWDHDHAAWPNMAGPVGQLIVVMQSVALDACQRAAGQLGVVVVGPNDAGVVLDEVAMETGGLSRVAVESVDALRAAGTPRWA